MVAWLYLWVFLAQLYGLLRITFQGDATAIVGDAAEGKHLSGHLKHKRIRAKGQLLGHTWFEQATGSEILDVHGTSLQVLDDKVHHPGQKHQHRYLVDGVHGAQVEVRLAVLVLFAEEVGEHL